MALWIWNKDVLGISLIQVGMEPERVTGMCVGVETPTCILVRTKTLQRVFFENVAELKPQLLEKRVSSAWVSAVQYLLDNVQGREVEFVVSQKRKTYYSGRVLVEGKDIAGEMICEGLLKLSSRVEGWTQLEEKARSRKIGLWNDKKRELKFVTEEDAKKKYSDLTESVQKRCYVQRVEGLKMFLVDVDTLEEIVWYMSQLKIPRMNGLDPRKAFVATQDYTKDKLSNLIVECTVKGCDIYKGEVSLLGSIQAGEVNLTEELVRAGYAELSKNAESILRSAVFDSYTKLEKDAKAKGFGFFKKKTQKESVNTTGMSFSNKLKQYQYWVKEERKANTLKNPTEELSEILSNYRIDGKEELTDGKMKRLRTLSQVASVLLTGAAQKHRPELIEFYKNTFSLFSLLTGQLILNLQSLEYIKLINVLLRSINTCISQLPQKEHLADIEKLMRTIFRLTFLGNNIFHPKIFGKQKEIQIENFSFDNREFSGSSVSEVSDDERPDREHIKKKRLNDAYSKVRINSSLLLHQFVKLVPTLLETNWQLMVKPNPFSPEFTDFVNELSFRSEVPPLTSSEKDKIINLMRINFGEHSSLSLLIFQPNPKIKLNILNSMQIFICGYQGRRIIQTIDYSKFEKEMKQSKSFIPKSFLVFSAYRNLYYTLLFCLNYERDPEIRILLLKAISNIVEHTCLLQKLPFDQTLRILIQNFLLPILGEDDHNTSILRSTVIGCLGAIVSMGEGSADFDKEYLGQNSLNNIPRKMIGLLHECRLSGDNNKHLQDEINLFFTSLIKYYMQSLTRVSQQSSIWLELLKQQDPQSESFSKVVEEICKRFNNSGIEDDNEEREQEDASEIQGFKKYFMESYLPQYLRECENFNSSAALINLINICCQLKSDTWGSPLFQRGYEFLLEIFRRLSPYTIQLQPSRHTLPLNPRFEQMKNNPYVRVVYLRLIGYMSFICKFRTKQIAQHSFRIILSTIKTVKGLNTLIKCSWALSSWCNFEGLADVLSREEAQEVFDRLVEFNRSEREKIASHGARGLGLFALNMSLKAPLPEEWISTTKDELNSNMKNKSAKVSWNSLISLRMLLRIPTLNSQDLLQHKLMQGLIHNFSRNNFKLQLQTIQTLKCLPNKEQTQKYATQISRGMMQVLEETSKQELTEYSFAEFKYVEILRKEIVRYFVSILVELDAGALREVVAAIDLYLLLVSINKHLVSISTKQEEPQKSYFIEEKGKEKGEETEREVFNVKKKVKFHEEQKVSDMEPGYQKIFLRICKEDSGFFSNLKRVGERVREAIEKDEAMKINFSVVEGFDQLSHMTIIEEEVQVNILQL